MVSSEMKIVKESFKTEHTVLLQHIRDVKVLDVGCRLWGFIDEPVKAHHATVLPQLHILGPYGLLFWVAIVHVYNNEDNIYTALVMSLIVHVIWTKTPMFVQTVLVMSLIVAQLTVIYIWYCMISIIYKLYDIYYYIIICNYLFLYTYILLTCSEHYYYD